MLEIENLSVAYGHVSAVRDVSLNVAEGETVGLIGPNGAGKTSVLKAIVGLAPIVGGEVHFMGAPLSNRSTEHIVRSGISMVAEGRQVFTRLTVEENLVLAAKTAGHKGSAALDGVTDRFPILRKYRALPAGQLSGGEQQMLVIGRAPALKAQDTDSRRAVSGARPAYRRRGIRYHCRSQERGSHRPPR